MAHTQFNCKTWVDTVEGVRIYCIYDYLAAEKATEYSPPYSSEVDLIDWIVNPEDCKRNGLTVDYFHTPEFATRLEEVLLREHESGI